MHLASLFVRGSGDSVGAEAFAAILIGVSCNAADHLVSVVMLNAANGFGGVAGGILPWVD